MEQGKLVKELLNRFNKLKGDRTIVDTTWQTIADYCLPYSAEITRKSGVGYNTSDRNRIFDGTASKAVEYLASELHGGLTNPMISWFSLKLPRQLPQDQNTSVFLEQARTVMLDLFNSSSSCFPSQNHEFILSLVAYGTACMFVEDTIDKGIKFATIHVSEIFIAEDSYGMIDSVFREFQYTARQLYQRFGDANHKRVIEEAEKAPDTKHKILHVVLPKSDSLKPDKKFHKFVSFYIDLDNGHLISKGGFIEFPYIIARFSKLSGEVYGRSPAWQVMSEIKMVNRIRETIIKAAQLQATPPLLVADDGVMMPLRAVPNGLIMGGISYDGFQRVQPLNVGGNLGIGIEMIRDAQKAIRDAFFVDQLVFRDGPTMTATEVVQRQQESLRLLAPHLGRLATEYLTPLIEKVFSMLARGGKLGPVERLPQAVVQAGYEVEFLGPLSLLQKASKIQQFQQFLGYLGPIAQVSPTALQNIDFDQATRLIAQDLGIWPSILRDPEAIAQERQQQEQLAALQQGMGGLQQMAEINKLMEPK